MVDQCGVRLGEASVHDEHGCRLKDGHQGAHEFTDDLGRLWCWETDFECQCEHCMKCEGDYCTTYWIKQA